MVLIWRCSRCGDVLDVALIGGILDMKKYKAIEISYLKNYSSAWVPYLCTKHPFAIED